MPKQRIDVFISSTSIDLPEYRATVRDAILSLGLYPSGMETWPVEDTDPVSKCRQMVEEAEIYLGIFAHRYGWRPEGGDGKSITEMEYDWATERGIPRLCFVIDDDHPWPQSAVEHEAKADLDAFKARVKAQVVGFFTTPEDIKAQVIAALAGYAPEKQRTLSLADAEPYLNWLHHTALRSGLLQVLDPRSSDATSRSTQITVDQVYTPLDTRGVLLRDKDGQALLGQAFDQQSDETQMSPLTAMEAANLRERFVLLGDPGSGKSTFITFMALCLSGHYLDSEQGWLDRLSEQGWTHGPYLPIVVTLRDFAQSLPVDDTPGQASFLWEHITTELARRDCAGAESVLRQHVQLGKALLMLDGLDEVPGTKRDLVRDTLVDFMSAHPSNRYIITCRVLSYANPAWRIPDSFQETLAPFDSPKVEHFVRAWYTAASVLQLMDEDTAQQRIADLMEGLSHRHLQEVSSNPMLLTVMALIHNHTGALPRESARLYDECVKLLMFRWRPQFARSLLDELDVREDKLYRLLWEIAYHAHSEQAGREGAADISERDVVFLLRDSLGGDLGKAQRFCEYVEQRAGLLIGRGQDAHGARVFAFPHRTFQEYLAGCYIASSRFVRHVRELARLGQDWREVVMLATGHLVFNQGDIATPLDAIDVICPARPPRDDDDWRAAWLAGDMLLLMGIRDVESDDVGREVLPRVRERLTELVSGKHLDSEERAQAAITLADLTLPEEEEPQPIPTSAVATIARLPGDVWEVIVCENLDSENAEVLRTMLEALLSAGRKWLLVDMSDVSYISSSGLQVLVSLWRRVNRMEGSMVLANLQPRTREVFDIVGFDQIFDIFDTREEALTQLLTD